MSDLILPTDEQVERAAASEIWKDIPGYEGLYQASTFGRIRSLDRKVPGGGIGGVRTIKSLRGRILKPGVSGGYLTVNLGAGNTALVHRIVLTTFVGPCPAGMECAHEDGVRTNARLDNLSWKTPKTNNQDKFRHGTQRVSSEHPWWSGDTCHRGHERTGHNLRISPRGKRYCRTCAREYAVIWRARNRPTETGEVKLYREQK